MKYVVDTNILIFLCNAKSEKLEQRFKKHPVHDFCVSTVTVGELIYGAYKSKQKSRNLESILKILSPFTVIEYDSKDAWKYGELRAELEANGRIIGGNDLIIAAQALQRGLIVITNNTREYGRVKGLIVEDWTK